MIPANSIDAASDQHRWAWWSALLIQRVELVPKATCLAFCAASFALWYEGGRGKGPRCDGLSS